MIKRPKPGENEDDILRMQEEFLNEKSKNNSHQPAAQVVNLRRRTEPTKRASILEAGSRKPSKYAQSKGLKSVAEKKPRTEVSCSSVVGDILEKNIEPEEELPHTEDDKVYYPKIIPTLLGEIIEKNLDEVVDFQFPMPPKGFPVATKRDLSIKPGLKSIHAQETERTSQTPEQMEVDEPTSSNIEFKQTVNVENLPEKSYILNTYDANDIHQENVKLLSQMSEKEIMEEQTKLLSKLDSKLVAFIKAKRSQGAEKQHKENKPNENEGQTSCKKNGSVYKTCIEENMDASEPSADLLETDTLWENDVLSHPNVDKWLHFDSFEKDKLEWMKGIEQSKKINADEPYEARFNFKGYLLPYTMEYTEENKTLFHHGDEPNRPGYSLTELFELSRSTVIQQRVMALNIIAGVLEYYNAGTYKDVIEIPLSKVFFVIRIAMDENKTIILEPALKALRNLIYNRIDEACLDALIGFEEGKQQPCLENDKSEIEELETTESELKDYHLAEIDIIAALLRTDILQRIYYILETAKPSFNCVQYALQILIRLARDSIESASKIVELNHLFETIIKNFVPTTGINFTFEPQAYNGKPILAAVKLIRVLSLQSQEIGQLLVSKYNILNPVSEYVSSGVDGTYGLQIQIEALCVLSNLLRYDIGIDNARSLSPIIITTLYKHVHGTDLLINSSMISATHAAVVLQFVNMIISRNVMDFESCRDQIYPLLKQGVQKWLAQLSRSDEYTCGHLRLLCAALDCSKTIILIGRLNVSFLNDSLKRFSTSRGFKEIAKHLIPSSNLLSGIESKSIHSTKNLMSLGGSVIDSTQKVQPVLNVSSPLPFLASLFNVLVSVDDAKLSAVFLTSIETYIYKLANQVPSLCDSWFTRIESNFVLYIVQMLNRIDMPEMKRDLLYLLASKLCYILRIDQKCMLEHLFATILFNKESFTTERLMNLLSLSEDDGISLASIGDIMKCYLKVINFSNQDTSTNPVLRKWKEPILPRDWIYLPILMLYSKSQESDSAPKVVGEHAQKVAALLAAEKELIINCSLQWILLNEICFPDLLRDIDITDRFCRIMCVFLCDNSLFLKKDINFLLKTYTQLLFKKKDNFNFDKELVGLHSFQDFYTQFLEQFQSVSYGDHTFAACVLVPLAQKHNVKWRKLLWSEYAGCLRALDCLEKMLCYEMKEYLYPEETDSSLIKSYFQALSGNLLRPNTIAHRIAAHHLQAFKKKRTSDAN